MNEKRFVWECDGDTCHILDTVTKARYFYDGIDCLLNEQQSTIKQLQDLCGESDSENAKLRIENKRLQEENEQLRQRNRKLYKCALYGKTIGDEI